MLEDDIAHQDAIRRAQAMAVRIKALADDAFAQMLALIDAGKDERVALSEVLRGFNGEYTDALAGALSATLAEQVSARAVLAMPVGDISLSERLYRNVRQTGNEVAAIVKQHAQGLHDARALALRLYDGYNPQDGIARPLEGVARAQLPKALRELTASPGARQSLGALLVQAQQQAGRLKSEALKAGYLQLLKDWESGKGKEVLQERLGVAVREKTRYMANRIAQTELARAHQTKLAERIMQDDGIDVVQVRVNPNHPMPDICDLHARANLFGLGPGLYPKAKAPRPPFHPYCWCRLVTRPDLDAAQASEREEGAREYLRSLPPAEAARVLGNRERLQAVLGGADWEAVTQGGVRDEYRLRKVGDGVAVPVARKHATAIDKSFSASDFGQFIQGAIPGERPVAVLPGDLRSMLAANTDALLLSRETAAKQYRKHPEITAEDYRRVQAMLDYGEVRRDRGMHLGLLHEQGALYYAVIKATTTGNAVFLQTLRRTNASDINKIRARSTFVRGAQ